MSDPICKDVPVPLTTVAWLLRRRNSSRKRGESPNGNESEEAGLKKLLKVMEMYLFGLVLILVYYC
jgi:hypothetical protein